MILVWTGLAIAALALIAVSASIRPLRRFLKLREGMPRRLPESRGRARRRAGREPGHARRGTAHLPRARDAHVGLRRPPPQRQDLHSRPRVRSGLGRERVDRPLERASGLRHRANALARASRARLEARNGAPPRSARVSTPRSSCSRSRPRRRRLDVHGEPEPASRFADGADRPGRDREGQQNSACPRGGSREREASPRMRR